MADWLGCVAAHRRAIAAAEAAQLRAVAAWARVQARAWLDEHDGDDGWSGIVLPGQEKLVPLGGRGTPAVPEFCPATLAAELGLAQHVATALVADGLALVHRLPLLLAVLESGDVEPVRVRAVAAGTRDLSDRAIADLDAWLSHRATEGASPRIGRLSMRAVRDAVTQHVIVDAADQTLATEDEARTSLALAQRYVAFEHALDGTSDLHARLSTADAARLEASLDSAADAAMRDGDDRPVDVRRAAALGRLAVGEGLASTVLFVHHDRRDGTWSADGIGPITQTVGLDLIDLDHTHVTVTPVIDLDTETTNTGYRTGPRLRQALDLAQHDHCAYPYCQRRPMRGDADHVIPTTRTGPPPAPTCSCSAGTTTGSRPTPGGESPSWPPERPAGPHRPAPDGSLSPASPPACARELDDPGVF